MVRTEQGRPDLPQKEPLSEVASHLLEECRMVLPGIQALFGFQLMAVFNAKFLGPRSTHRLVHLLAIGLVAIAVALVMTPAAYHRLALQNSMSQSFIDVSSRLLLCSMFPLVLGTCLDFYLISTMILANVWWGFGVVAGPDGCLRQLVVWPPVFRTRLADTFLSTTVSIAVSVFRRTSPPFRMGEHRSTNWDPPLASGWFLVRRPHGYR